MFGEKVQGRIWGFEDQLGRKFNIWNRVVEILVKTFSLVWGKVFGNIWVWFWEYFEAITRDRF